jgi:hypothetical protein
MVGAENDVHADAFGIWLGGECWKVSDFGNESVGRDFGIACSYIYCWMFLILFIIYLFIVAGFQCGDQLGRCCGVRFGPLPRYLVCDSSTVDKLDATLKDQTHC